MIHFCMVIYIFLYLENNKMHVHWMLLVPDKSYIWRNRRIIVLWLNILHCHNHLITTIKMMDYETKLQEDLCRICYY